MEHSSKHVTRLVFATLTLSVLASSAILPILAPLMRSLQLSASQAGWMLSAGSLAMAAAAPAWGAANDRFGRRAVLVAGFAGMGLAYAAFAAVVWQGEAAALAGGIAALAAAHALGQLSREERDAKAAPLRRELATHRAIRPLLDALFRPPREILAPPGVATVVCRCEEVTAGAIRDAVALGATGPNQMKAYLRCGMGPCQGRLCGLTVSEIMAEARGKSVAEIGYYRIRPPIKPVTLGELAGLDV
jgi:bacterioferritin-associated ferredoxin